MCWKRRWIAGSRRKKPADGSAPTVSMLDVGCACAGPGKARTSAGVIAQTLLETNSVAAALHSWHPACLADGVASCHARVDRQCNVRGATFRLTAAPICTAVIAVVRASSSLAPSTFPLVGESHVHAQESHFSCSSFPWRNRPRWHRFCPGRRLWFQPRRGTQRVGRADTRDDRRRPACVPLRYFRR